MHGLICVKESPYVALYDTQVSETERTKFTLVPVALVERNSGTVANHKPKQTRQADGKG